MAASLLAALGMTYLWAPFGFRPGEYRTQVAEQRVIELEDYSRIALDADTRLKVRFSRDARTVRLLEGQAEFSVARDAGRPFKVQVGERTIVALGTKFTVEYIDREFNVAMSEGRVAVISDLECRCSRRLADTGFDSDSIPDIVFSAGENFAPEQRSGRCHRAVRGRGSTYRQQRSTRNSSKPI